MMGGEDDPYLEEFSSKTCKRVKTEHNGASGKTCI